MKTGTKALVWLSAIGLAPVPACTKAAERVGAGPYALNLGRWDTPNDGPCERILVREIEPSSLVDLPLPVEMPGPGLCAASLEADLTDYPGMSVAGVPEMPTALATGSTCAWPPAAAPPSNSRQCADDKRGASRARAEPARGSKSDGEDNDE